MAPRVPFAGYPLDRADAVRKDPLAVEACWNAPGARVLVYWRGKPLLADSAAGLAPAWQTAEAVGDPMVRLFMGLDADGHATFAACADPGAPAPTLAAAFQDLRASAARLTLDDASLLATARSVFAWHRKHRFCSNCGSPTEVASAGWKRQCPSCGAEHFPRVNPVVIALVTRGDRVLLGRGPKWPPRFFSCLAGFVEPGETLGDATRREVKEESGVDVGDVTYLFGQPWPFPASLMLGVQVEALHDNVVVDGEELAEARWFSREEVAAMLAGTHPEAMPPFPVAVAHHLLRWWLDPAETLQ